jgi:hypothetical protein
MKILLPIVLIAAPAMFAGEYGLAVGPSYPHPCKFEVSRSLNSCTTAAVAEDLRRHFISGEPFRLEAVKMAVLSGSIFIDRDALSPFSEVIVEICTADAPHDFDRLVSFLGYLPYRSLALRLARELENEERPLVRARLLKAFSTLPRAKPAIAAPPAPSPPRAALLAYKRDLHQAGDRNECEAAVQRVSRAMATDARLSDAAIQAEIDHFEKVKGPMPYPTPGTACSLFGFQEAAHAALDQRRPNAQ